MTITVVVKESRYFCYQDEKHFFAWLESIDAISDVLGVRGGLSFKVPDEGLDPESWVDLIGLLTRYGIDMTPLREMALSETTGWLKDPKCYWHIPLFGVSST